MECYWSVHWPLCRQRLHCELPNAILRQIPKCGHIPHVEKPDAVSKLIVDFVLHDQPQRENPESVSTISIPAWLLVLVEADSISHMWRSNFLILPHDEVSLPASMVNMLPFFEHCRPYSLHINQVLSHPVEKCNKLNTQSWVLAFWYIFLPEHANIILH